MLCLQDGVQAGWALAGEVEEEDEKEVEVGAVEAEVAEAEGVEAGPRDAAQRCLAPSPGDQENRTRATASAGEAVEARAAPATSST